MAKNDASGVSVYHKVFMALPQKVICLLIRERHSKRTFEAFQAY